MSIIDRMAPLALIAALGCGDALAPADFQGEPLLTLNGPITQPDGPNAIAFAQCDAAWLECAQACESCTQCDATFVNCVETRQIATPPPKLNLGLFWSGAHRTTDDSTDDAIPQVIATSQVRPSFPAAWTLSVYTPPPASLLTAGSTSGRYTLGLVLVWMDANHDGVWTRGADPIVGGARLRAVLYTPDGLDDARLGRFPAGFHPVSVEWECTPQAPSTPMIASDSYPMEVEVTAEKDFVRSLLFDVDCDGQAQDFEICPPELFEGKMCTAVDLGLCDLCRVK